MPSSPAQLAQSMRLDQQLCFAMYSASLAMTKLYKPLLEPLGLTYPQYLALLVLWEQNNCMVSELGERLFLDSGTLTPLLKRMEASGWLLRQRDPIDERRVRIRLTASGRNLRQQVAHIPGCLLERSQCQPSELQALTQEIQKLRDRMVHIMQPAPC